MSQYKNPYCSYVSFVFLLLLTMSCDIQAGVGGWVDDCQPCKLTIVPNKAPYLFTFNLTAEEDSMMIESISVTPPANKGPSQSLLVDFMTPVLKGEQFYFEASDINFDGFNDLLLVVSMGAANSYAKYWLYNSVSQKFDYLDEYPIFKVDVEKKSLSTYERGGHGGMIFDKKSYEVINKKIIVVKSEVQEWVEDKRVYLNTVKSLKNGILTLVKETKVQPPQ